MGNAGEQGDPDGEPGNASEVVALSADGISATAEDE